MFNNQVYYHGLIRKTVVSFGRLFSDIKIQRQNNDGVIDQSIAVPLSYAPKEKWIVRIDSDPGLNNNTYTTLPRMSFEITGYSYDATRKINKMNKITCEQASGDIKRSMFTPVPYNVDFSLYILTKTQEDAMQIIEQILPSFTPEYTLSINAVPAMNIVQDVPIILNSITVQDDYDGDFETRRFVTHTLNFTAKINLYGYVSDQGIIKDVTVNTSVGRKYNAQGDLPGDPITESWLDEL